MRQATFLSAVPLYVTPRLQADARERCKRRTVPRSEPHGTGSADDFVGDSAVDIGQTEIAAGVAEGESLVIQSQEVQDRGVQIVDVHGILRHVPGDVVGLAHYLPTLDAAAGQPNRS